MTDQAPDLLRDAPPAAAPGAAKPRKARQTPAPAGDDGQAASCASCRFRAEAASDGWLRCRRFPPSIHPVAAIAPMASRHPRVAHNDWCGEFEREESAR